MGPSEAARSTEGAVPAIIIVSGGVGASGEQLVRTALAQFPSVSVSVAIVPHVRTCEEVEEVVRRATSEGSLLVHTMVDPDLRLALAQCARKQDVSTVDLIGRLLDALADLLGQAPVGQPGLYRQLHKAYFERVDAIEFAVTHDDGLRVHELEQAEIVLTGVSRSGKTPLSMYLSVLGWKVANVPWVDGADLPQELLQLDPRRVVGLTIEPGQLVSYRRWRQRRLGTGMDSDYIAPQKLYDEVEAAEKCFRKYRFAVLDVTDKPLESSAEEIIDLVARRLRK